MKKVQEIIILIVAGLVAVAAVYAAVIVIDWAIPIPSPFPQTLYLTANLFPIQGGNYFTGYMGNRPITNSTFYGVVQPNGTECIDKVVIRLFNYTTQGLSKPEAITDPKQVAVIYNNYSGFTSSLGIQVAIPAGYTLLCPNIVNATRWS